MPQVCEEATGLVVVHPLQDFNHRPHEPQSWEQTLNMSENLERSHTIRCLFFSEAKKLKVPDQYETHSDDWSYDIYEMLCDSFARNWMMMMLKISTCQKNVSKNNNPPETHQNDSYHSFAWGWECVTLTNLNAEVVGNEVQKLCYCT